MAQTMIEKTLRAALTQLETERDRAEKAIKEIRNTLRRLGASIGKPGPKKRGKKKTASKKRKTRKKAGKKKTKTAGKRRKKVVWTQAMRDRARKAALKRWGKKNKS